MKGACYQILVQLTRIVGQWFFVAVSRIIAAGYFSFSPRTGESHRFYATLFQDRSPLYHRWCTFIQYQNFTTIHLDRLLLTEQPDIISYTSEGLEYLGRIDKNKGAIILQSHLGNWDIAAHLLQQQNSGLNMLLYMGIKDKEDVERLQKEQLRSSGIRIIGVDRDGGSPFDAVEGINHLRSGGVVSMTGDIIWRQEQRSVEVDFLGHKARLPEAPYVFGLLSGAPILVFFTFRTGNNSYHFTLSKPIVIKATSRDQRQNSIQQAAQQYANLLQQTLLQHPFEWYHFDRFIY